MLCTHFHMSRLRRIIKLNCTRFLLIISQSVKARGCNRHYVFTVWWDMYQNMCKIAIGTWVCVCACSNETFTKIFLKSLFVHMCVCVCAYFDDTSTKICVKSLLVLECVRSLMRHPPTSTSSEPSFGESREVNSPPHTSYIITTIVAIFHNTPKPHHHHYIVAL